VHTARVNNRREVPAGMSATAVHFHIGGIMRSFIWFLLILAAPDITRRRQPSWFDLLP
jgi:hypothetical protein